MRAVLGYIVDSLSSLWYPLDSTPAVKLNKYKRIQPLTEQEITIKVVSGIRKSWFEVGNLMKDEFKKVKNGSIKRIN